MYDHLVFVLQKTLHASVAFATKEWHSHRLLSRNQVVFSYYLLNKTTTPRTLVCLGVVVLGFYLGTEGEVNFSLIGSIFGLLASCFVRYCQQCD